MAGSEVAGSEVGEFAPVVNPHIRFTERHYQIWPEDGRRWELLDGEMVPMSPAPNAGHQAIVGNLYSAIRSFLAASPIGRVFVSPFDVYLGRHDVVQPDLVYVRKERIGLIKRRGCVGTPDLLVEILSSEPSRDREVKFRTYARFGVVELWIVDPEQKAVEVYREPTRDYVLWRAFPLEATLSSPLLTGFAMPVVDVFAGSDWEE